MSAQHKGISSILSRALGKVTRRMATASTSHPAAAGKKNRLQHEKSPYLLQHQTNPVDWHSWSPEAFELAKKKNMPIFLSVGYSTCHWCHVMERESFESESVAKVMNDKFINIKMDREERPDIDRIYMTFVQAISGSGGWPMSVWMTPDLKPIYAGTYYPPDDRYFGRPGFRSLLESISEQWVENETKCRESGEKIIAVLKKGATIHASDAVPKAEAAARCVQQFTRNYEPSRGGFSEQPKFPQPANLIFLIDWAVKNPKDSGRFSVVKMVETTLKEMAKGGIHDHVGQGFARYSTDSKWHVPHFEKMLYDQGQLAVAYANAYLLTKDATYADIVRDILTYVGRDLSHSEGGFYSAEDADSYPTFTCKEKKEGGFYVWKDEEIDEIVGTKLLSNKKATAADVVKLRFGVQPKGNVNPLSDPHDELKEQNVLFQAKSVQELAKAFEVPEQEIKEVLEEARVELFNYRNVNRPRPGLDTKLITSWNGLMISGYAKAGVALNDQEYIERAMQAVTFLEKYVFKTTEEDGSLDLLRACYREDSDGSIVNISTPIYGCVDDFCNLISACLELYFATSDLKYMQLAIKLQNSQDNLFWDTAAGGYFTSRAGDPYVLIRLKDDDDGAEPSSNSTSLLNLLRFNALLHDDDFATKAEQTLKQFGDRLSKIPMTLPIMTAALTTHFKEPLVIVYNAEDESHNQIKQKLLPIGTSLIGLKPSDKDGLSKSSALFPDAKAALEKDATLKQIAVFRGKNDPVYLSSVEELEQQIA